MTSRTRSILGWTPFLLVGLFLIMASGGPKLFLSSEGSSLQPLAESLGIWDILMWIGILEVVCGLLLLFPRTATVGFVLSVGLLGGATATGLTHNNPDVWPWFPLVLLFLLTFGAYYRTPELLSRILKRPVPSYGLFPRIIGWVCALLIALMNVFAALTKFFPSMAGEQGAAFAQQVGMAGMEPQLGVVEVIATVLFLIPRTSTVGFVLMTGYMGGVLATNLTHGFRGADVMPLFVSLVLLALAGWLRNPELVSRLMGRSVPEKI